MVRLNLAYRERCIPVLHVSGHLFPNLNVPQWHRELLLRVRKGGLGRNVTMWSVSPLQAAEISLQDPLNSPGVHLTEPVFRVVQSGLADTLWATYKTMPLGWIVIWTKVLSLEELMSSAT